VRDIESRGDDLAGVGKMVEETARSSVGRVDRAEETYDRKESGSDQRCFLGRGWKE
jgi:hypothetical protein